MTSATHERRSPLGLFPDKPTPRLYDRSVELPHALARQYPNANRQ